MWLIEYPNRVLSLLASVVRLGAGADAAPVDLHRPIILYEFEGCPFCRIAREAVSQSGVPVLVRPCPKGGKRFRPSVKEQGGKAQFPYMVDPNTQTAMYESADIAKYLRKTYGGRGRPFIYWLGPVNLLLSQIAVLLRLMGGTFAKKSTPPSTPLEFFGAERHPAARLVKELLCEREIDYLWRSRAKDGSTAPHLFDPNIGEERNGSRAIRDYLNQTYRR